jgi:hypothetical protein
MYASIGIEKIILYSLFLASVILVPNSIDPITVPRLVVISIFGFISFFILINNLDNKIIRKRKMVIFAGLIFIILGLSKFNKKELAGNRLYNPIVKKQLFCFVFIWILFYILIFEFNI